MIIRNILVSVMLFHLLLSSSCIASQSNLVNEELTESSSTPQPSPTLEKIITQSPESSPTLIDTPQTSEVITNTPQAITTSLPDIIVPMELKCPEVSPSSTISQITGQLVLQPTDSEPAYLLDLETQETISLHSSNAIAPQNIVVSPEWLVFEGASKGATAKDSIVFQSADGEVLTFPRSQFDTAIPSLWLNEETIAFHAINIHGLDWLVLFNLETREVSDLRVEQLPGIFGDDFVQQAGWATLASFSPDLQKVIYMGDAKLLLWDLEQGQLISKFNDFRETYNPPRWSPDGSRLVFVKRERTENEEGWNDKLIIVDRDGEIISEMQFAPKSEEVQILSYRWSPDSRLLGLWLNNNFIVVDSLTNEATNYCITTTANLPQIPVWSPDSTQIAIGVEDENQMSNTIVIDMNNGIRSVLLENVVPMGWMR